MALKCAGAGRRGAQTGHLRALTVVTGSCRGGRRVGLCGGGTGWRMTVPNGPHLPPVPGDRTPRRPGSRPNGVGGSRRLTIDLTLEIKQWLTQDLKFGCQRFLLVTSNTLFFFLIEALASSGAKRERGRIDTPPPRPCAGEGCEMVSVGEG